ncbi:MAG: DUF1150 family protein [Rubellimicrobium sp.]|nr:DUF1150 family protein [Rubellimicrobium sp.]
MDVKYDLGALGEDVVYVKPVAVASLPEEIRNQVHDLDVIFAVHDAQGTRLALVANRELAFFLARQHDKVPMTVH